MTQFDKKNYIVEGSILDFYLEQGMILEKSPECPLGIHKKLVYKKWNWLESYMINTIQL